MAQFKSSSLDVEDLKWASWMEQGLSTWSGQRVYCAKTMKLRSDRQVVLVGMMWDLYLNHDSFSQLEAGERMVGCWWTRVQAGSSVYHLYKRSIGAFVSL